MMLSRLTREAMQKPHSAATKVLDLFCFSLFTSV